MIAWVETCVLPLWLYGSLVARTREETEEVDEQRHPPHVPVPRWTPGPARPGYVPYRLFIIMELITRASQLHQSHVYCVLVKRCWLGCSSTYYPPYEAFVPPATPFVCCDFFAGQCAISKAFTAKSYSSCALDIDIDPRDESCFSYSKRFGLTFFKLYIYICL